MTTLLTIIAFFVIFSTLIIVHELGHFWAARKAGVYVQEFGFGLPPKFFGKETSRSVKIKGKDGKIRTKKEKMIWSLNWIPFGGFVRMLGEDDDSKEAKEDPRSFGNRPVLSRIFVVIAGVVMNFALGWVLLVIVFASGVDPLILASNEFYSHVKTGTVETTEGVLMIGKGDFQTNVDAGVIEVFKGVSLLSVKEASLAEEKGLKAGDIITYFNQDEIIDFQSLQNAVKNDKSTEAHVTIERKTESEFSEKIVFILPVNKLEEVGIFSIIPPISKINKIKLPLGKAMLVATKEEARLSVLTVKMFGDVIAGFVKKLAPPEGVSGPVGIARMTHSFVELGNFIQLLLFMALISISLAVVNILPFPALDGGRLIFLIIELIIRKKPNPAWEARIHAGGLAFLLFLIILVTFADIKNWIDF